jgi:hypothetical protein
MPVMDAANPIVGIAIGLALFDERVDLSGWHLLDTSPLVQRIQRIQDGRRASRDRVSQGYRHIGMGMGESGRTNAADI